MKDQRFWFGVSITKRGSVAWDMGYGSIIEIRICDIIFSFDVRVLMKIDALYAVHKHSMMSTKKKQRDSEFDENKYIQL